MIRSFKSASGQEKVEYLRSRLDELKRLRTPWLDKWREVSDYISPFSGRFEITDKQETRSYQFIFDNEAGRSVDILTSGLASSATSPVRPWFSLTTPSLKARPNDVSLKKKYARIERLLLEVFQRSNTYNSLHMLYRDLCLFGVGVDLIYTDEQNVIRHHILPVGEYCLQVNEKGIVDTLYREFVYTVKQAVQFFGYENLSTSIQESYDDGFLDRDFRFCQAIEPRIDRDPKSKKAKDMPFASYYFCLDDNSKDIIKEGGFKEFPALCPRWDALSGATYGLSPGITALPTVKQLQMEVNAKAEILELMAKPPMQAPSIIHNKYRSISPDQIIFTMNTGQDQQIKPIYQPSGGIQAITADIATLQQSIRSMFYVDLFMMIQQAQDDRKTAAEIYALKEEKMLVLGSVVERLQHELLAPLVKITYSKLVELQLVEPLENGLDVEFRSMLAQSQLSVDINSIDRFLSMVQALSASDPSVIDLIDMDQLVRGYADRMVVPPDMMRSEKDVQDIRDQRNQQIQQQQDAENAITAGTTLNQLAQAQKAGAEASATTQSLSPIGGGLGGLSGL